MRRHFQPAFLLPRLKPLLAAGLKSHAHHAPLSSSNAAQSRQGLDFSNTEELFSSESTRDLLRAYVVFKMFDYDVVVRKGKKLLRAARRFLGLSLFNRLMKATVYGQFVAGEDTSSIRPKLAHLRANGVRAILDYAVEEDVIGGRPSGVSGGDSSKQVATETRQTQSEPSPPVSVDDEMALKASARNYVYRDEERCNENVKNFLSCIEMAAKVSQVGEVPFAAIKLTGLGKTNFLLKLSEVLVRLQNLCTDLSDGHLDHHSYELTRQTITHRSLHNGLNRMGVVVTEAESEVLYRDLAALGTAGDLRAADCTSQFHLESMQKLLRIMREKKKGSDFPPLALEEDENEQMKSVLKRMETLLQAAKERSVRLMIDAEQSYFQPAIRHIAVDLLMPRYNQRSPLIYNTLQCYLKDSATSLEVDLALSARRGFCYGAKLVRGAYMEQERKLALKKCYKDPVFAEKSDTDANYDRLVDSFLSRMRESNRISLLVATHNERSIQLATKRMEEYGIERSSNQVAFGQLLGMCDHISFTLGRAGYGAYKYVPYGPVGEVLPYLLRRANENKSMLEGADRERLLLGKELKRRLSPFSVSR